MKATKLTVKNIGIIADAVIEINKPLIVFYGDVMQGKSTILNSLKWCMGGTFPDDLIRHGTAEASIQFEATDRGVGIIIRREFYLGKDQSVKARAIQFTRGGQLQRKPADEIAKFLNPFLFDQDHLRKMSDVDRSRFLVELFAVDTTFEDGRIFDAAREAQELRAKVKGYGEIDTTPVEPVGMAELLAELGEARKAHVDAVAVARREFCTASEAYEESEAKVDADNRKVREHNAKVTDARRDSRENSALIGDIRHQIERLEERLEKVRKDKKTADAWLSENAERAESERPDRPDTSAIQARIDAPCDTSAIEAKITEAAAQNVRAEQYAANKARAQAKAADEERVLALEREQRELKSAKIAKLAEVGSKTGIAGLAFAEDGSFAFEGVSAGMLSDSQIMRLSQALSGLYPEGFGLTLIDRGESLGRSVLDLWKDAQARERSILVTVVGDKPAKIPEQVGAFVIEQGKIQ